MERFGSSRGEAGGAQRVQGPLVTGVGAGQGWHHQAAPSSPQDACKAQHSRAGTFLLLCHLNKHPEGKSCALHPPPSWHPQDDFPDSPLTDTVPAAVTPLWAWRCFSIMAWNRFWLVREGILTRADWLTSRNRIPQTFNAERVRVRHRSPSRRNKSAN